MSVLGKLTNIRTVILEHTNRGLYNYNLGKNLIKNGNMGDYQTRNLVQDSLKQIWIAIETLDKLEYNPVAEIAMTNLKDKARKLEKKLANAQSNVEWLPKLKQILNETNFDTIEENEAEEIAEQVIKMTQYNTSSKTTMLSLEILSKLSKFAPKEANNNNAPVAIENPKAEEESEDGSVGDLLEVPQGADLGFGEDLFLDFGLPNLSLKEDDDFGVNNNSFTFLPPVKQETPMELINQALQLVLNAKAEDYNEALQEFLKTIKTSSGILEKEGFPNFEHILHGLLYNTFVKLEMETNDVEGKPFGQYAMEVGLVPSDMLQDCCKKALTIVYLSVLDKVLSSDQLNSERAIEDLMPEIEALDLDTAHKIYGETWNHATKEERNQPNSDFGKEAFRSLNNVKVSLDTKIKAVKTVLDIRKKEYGIK